MQYEGRWAFDEIPRPSNEACAAPCPPGKRSRELDRLLYFFDTLSSSATGRRGSLCGILVTVRFRRILAQ